MSLHRLKDYLVVCCALIVGVLAYISLSTLEVTSDNRVFYDEESPEYIELIEVEELFELYSSITFLIVSDEELTKSTADALDWLSKEVVSYQGYVRHHSLENFPHIDETDDEITVTTVLEAACKDDQKCNELRDTEVFPELVDVKNRLVSPDARAFSVSVVIDIEVGDNPALNKLSGQIDDTVRKFEDRNVGKLKIAYTGAIPMMQAFADASSRDLGRLFPISIILILTLSIILFGSVYYAASALICSILNVIWVMGLASLFGLAINSATSTLPLALLVISISSSAHLICYIRLRLNENNEYRELINQSKRANATPILLASLTTCIGLATLSFVDIPPFREFGLLASLGTITNYFIVIYLLPAVLRLMPVGATKLSGAIFNRSINRYARFIDSGRLPVKSVLLVVALAAIGLVNFSIDEDYVQYFDESHEFRVGADLLTQKLASPYSIDVTVDFGEAGAALDTTNLRALAKFQKALTDEPLVVNSLSIVQHLRTAKRAFGLSTDDDISIENQNDYLQQMFLAYELSLPFGHSTSQLLDANHEVARISLLLGAASTKSLIELERRAHKIWQEQRANFPNNAELKVTGETLPLAHLSKKSLMDALLSVTVCIVLLFFGVMVSTKSITLAFLGVSAIVAPLAVAFGAWTWIDGEFGLGTAIIIAVTIGILVDDTIHFLYRYRLGRLNHGLSSESAISYAIHHSAAGIVSSSLILVSGFLVLCFSSFAVNQQFGIGVSLTIASALCLTLIGLPAALIALKPNLN